MSCTIHSMIYKNITVYKSSRTILIDTYTV